MNKWKRLSSAFFVVLCGMLLLGAAEQKVCLYVVNTLSDDLSVVDSATGEVSNIPLGVSGYHIAFSPQHNFALVTATSHMVPIAQQAGAASKSEFSGLMVIDLAHQRCTSSIPLTLSPLAQVYIPPDGKQAFVVTAAAPGSRNRIRGQVLFVDLLHSAVTGTVNIGLNPLDSVMSPDGTKLFTADWGSKSISIVDLTAGRLYDSIPLGSNPPRVLALSADGDTLFAGLELQPAGHQETTTGSIANMQVQTQAGPQFMNADTSLLWAYNTKTGTASKFLIPGLQKVLALAVNPDGRRLYLYGRMSGSAGLHAQSAQAEANTLLVFDPIAQRVIGNFGNFGGLATMEVSADGSRLYLIGTHGDSAQEAALRAKIEQNRIANSTRQNGLNIKPGMPGMNAELNNNASVPNAESETISPSNTDISDIIDELSRIHKTITVLDAANGRRLAVYTVGSLPQGSGWLR